MARARWYVDEGLAVFIAQWKKKFPRAVVYTIGDDNHTVGEHVPEEQGSQPGQDTGEVDACDVMPGNGVTEKDLAELHTALIVARDPRILYVIWHDMIVSSVVQPWKIRKYTGKWHGHVHISVNDRYDANRAPWDIERGNRPVEYQELKGRLPIVRLGDEDQPGRTQHIHRLQATLNWLVHAGLDVDGVYGRKSAAAVAKAMKDDQARTTSNGARIELPEWRRILGVW